MNTTFAVDTSVWVPLTSAPGLYDVSLGSGSRALLLVAASLPAIDAAEDLAVENAKPVTVMVPAGMNLYGLAWFSALSIIVDHSIDAEAVPAAFAAVGDVLTRAANGTPYSALDSISNHATPGSVLPFGVVVGVVGQLTDLLRIRLNTSDTGFGGKQIKAVLYNSDPTLASGVVGGDNLAFSNKKAGYVGTMSGTFVTFSDGAVAILVPDQSTKIRALAGLGGKFWYQLEAVEAVTPTNSSTFTPTFEGEVAR